MAFSPVLNLLWRPCPDGSMRRRGWWLDRIGSSEPLGVGPVVSRRNLEKRRPVFDAPRSMLLLAQSGGKI